MPHPSSLTADVSNPPSGWQGCGVAVPLLQCRVQAELRATQYALRQSQKLETVGHLTGGLIHDFNNVLTIISGTLETIQMRVSQGRSDDTRVHIEAARDATRRAAAVIQRLLVLSRRTVADPQLIEADRLIEAMRDLVRRAMGAEIMVDVVASSGRCHVLVDPSEFEAAVLNLCINARDAMPRGGRLHIEIGTTWLGEREAVERGLKAGPYVLVCVTDTGIGMEPETLLRAFDPLFTTKPIGQGSGLGLSMVASFAQHSGGDATIVSEPGQGTAISFVLPQYQAA